MKKGILYITAILALSILQACGGKKQNLQFESPDKLTKVELKGDKANALDPWMLEIIISSGGKSGTLKTEFHTSEIDTNSVKLVWQEDNMAQLKLIEQDDKIRTVLIRSSANGVQAQELTLP